MSSYCAFNILSLNQTFSALKTRYLFKLVLIFLSSCEALNPGQEILKKSIDFHDPQGQWNVLQNRFHLQSDFVYPDSANYELEIGLHNPSKLVSYQNKTLSEQIEFTDSTCVVVQGNKTCEQASWTKNFYHFILGLPMTLDNEEAIVDQSVVETEFNSIPSYRIRIDFEKEKWHFYFSKSDYHLVGFAFNKNFQNKAEEIVTGGMIKLNDLVLCESRTWWITTDTLNPIYSGRDIILTSKSW